MVAVNIQYSKNETIMLSIIETELCWWAFRGCEFVFNHD